MRNLKSWIQKSLLLVSGILFALSVSSCTKEPVNCSTATRKSAGACGELGCVWNPDFKICSAPRCDSLTSSAACTKFIGNLWDPSQNCICAQESTCKDATDDVSCNGIGCVWDNVQCLRTGTLGPACKVATTEAGCTGIGCVWDPANANNNNKAQCLSKAIGPFGSACTAATTQNSCTALGCTWSGTVCGNPTCSTLSQAQCAGFDRCVWDSTTCINASSSCTTAATQTGCGAPNGLMGCIWSGTSCIAEKAYCSEATTDTACAGILPAKSCVWDPTNKCLSTSSWFGASCSKGTTQSSCVGLGCVWDGNDATTGTCLNGSNCSDMKTRSGCLSTIFCSWTGGACVE